MNIASQTYDLVSQTFLNTISFCINEMSSGQLDQGFHLVFPGLGQLVVMSTGKTFLN